MTYFQNLLLQGIKSDEWNTESQTRTCHSYENMSTPDFWMMNLGMPTPIPDGRANHNDRDLPPLRLRIKQPHEN